LIARCAGLLAPEQAELIELVEVLVARVGTDQAEAA
jgi:hypothetical protein